LSPRLLEHASERVEPAIRVLLEDALAALTIEVVMATLIAEPKRALAERLLAHDADPLLHHSSSMIGWCARTSCPLSIRMRRTLPLVFERISLNSFIASMSPTTSPDATLPPTCTNGSACGDGER